MFFDCWCKLLRTMQCATPSFAEATAGKAPDDAICMAAGNKIFYSSENLSRLIPEKYLGGAKAIPGAPLILKPAYFGHLLQDGVYVFS
jgi:hypothetical protein